MEPDGTGMRDAKEIVVAVPSCLYCSETRMHVRCTTNDNQVTELRKEWINDNDEDVNDIRN